MKIKTIEDALKYGLEFKCFSSGGRLRVCVLHVPAARESLFYGEAPNFHDALRVLKDDIKAGDREYKDVYGPIETHYLTGEYPQPGDVIDNWALSQDGIFAKWEKERVQVELKGSTRIETPKEVLDEINADPGHKTILWRFKDGNRSARIYSSTRGDYPGGRGVSTAVISGNNDWLEPVTLYGYAETFEHALADAAKRIVELETRPEWERVYEKDFKNPILE